ncbi:MULTISPECIES: carbohydrate ABC transporter permease [Haloferax]|uniref:Sugar ABC transporter permease n=5 Tax=Haloferax TaxID=2251 RepID=A0A384LBF9_HALVD|nr:MULTISPECIES: sugar ABC transporter permease [Haloferax]ADE01986.1 ABC-type transport system permease protein (probable substrate sugar) [Haloferax volcanii DS2]ELY37492.1 sugar ABC transporter permease [Haloferax volcanii DS2]ELZ89631.1 sugar ABC transporter permease [Haloferax alexandrinus JCM 10717]MBC9987749.1 sugar ABC transporter permease [Haloferax sp. AS1]MBS8120797.1 sugar ABC transporter permease [Haloferax volcanii]
MSTALKSRLEAAGSALRERDVDGTTLLLAACFVPMLAFFVVVWVIPIVYALGMSLFASPVRSPEFVGLGNYAELLGNGAFWGFLWNSVVYAVATTGLSLVIGLGLALVINQRIRGGDALRTLMIFPYLLPTLVVIFMWKFILDPNIGILNQFLVDAGLIDKPIAFFSTLEFAMPAVVVTSVWKFASFAFFILLARLQAIDPDLYERARVEGATTWQAFRDITFPHLRGAILIILLVRGIWMFNKFDIIYLSTRGGPLQQTTTLPIRVYQLAFSEVNFGMATALAGVMFFLLAGVAVVYFRAFAPEKEVA